MLYHECLPKDILIALAVVYISILYYCGDIEPAIMEFTTRARGAPAVIYNGFKYLVNQRNASGRIYWRCAVNRKCGGSVTTEDGVLLRENAVHTHPPSQVQAQVDKVVSTMRKRAREEIGPIYLWR